MSAAPTDVPLSLLSLAVPGGDVDLLQAAPDSLLVRAHAEDWLWKVSRSSSCGQVVSWSVRRGEIDTVTSGDATREYQYSEYFSPINHQ